MVVNSRAIFTRIFFSLLLLGGSSGCLSGGQSFKGMNIEGVGTLAEVEPAKLNDRELGLIVRAVKKGQSLTAEDVARLAEVYVANVGKFAAAFNRKDVEPPDFRAEEAAAFLRAAFSHPPSRNRVWAASQIEIGRLLAENIDGQPFPLVPGVLAAPVADFANAVAQALINSLPEGANNRPSEADIVSTLYYGAITVMRSALLKNDIPEVDALIKKRVVAADATWHQAPLNADSVSKWGTAHLAFFASIANAAERATDGDAKAKEFIDALKVYDSLAGPEEKILSASDGLLIDPDELNGDGLETTSDASQGMESTSVRDRGDEVLQQQRQAASIISSTVSPLISGFKAQAGG